MFDIGWTELLVIGVVALIVVGPKDLPMMFRTLGRFTGQAKSMAREFTRAMENAADDAGVKDIQKDLRNIANPRKMGVDAFKDATDGFRNWDPEKDTKADKASAEETKRGPETEKMTEERAEAVQKMRDAVAKKTADRQAEKADAAVTASEATPEPVDDKPA